MTEVHEIGEIQEILNDPTKRDLLEEFTQDALNKEGYQLILGMTDNGQVLSVVKDTDTFSYKVSYMDLGVDPGQVLNTNTNIVLDSLFVDYYLDGGSVAFPSVQVYKKFQALAQVSNEELDESVKKLFKLTDEDPELLLELKSTIGLYKKTGGFGRSHVLGEPTSADLGGKKLTPILEILNK